MLYIDDIVRLADNQSDMLPLINISSQEATDFGLKFSTEKSGITAFNDTSTDSVSIQHGELSRVEEYKYLGVWISEVEFGSVDK